jgi:hypothetical protein
VWHWLRHAECSGGRLFRNACGLGSDEDLAIAVQGVATSHFISFATKLRKPRRKALQIRE